MPKTETEPLARPRRSSASRSSWSCSTRPIVNIALPSIQHGLSFSDADLQWVINAYTLVFGGFLLLGGRAADLLGRKRLFVAGVVLFSLASLLNGLAQSSSMLIAGRALQGLGGALVSPAALSIIMTSFPGHQRAHQGAGRLERDRRRRRRGGPPARRHPHRPPVVGVDLLRQRARRHRGRRRGAAVRPRVA